MDSGRVTTNSPKPTPPRPSFATKTNNATNRKPFSIMSIIMIALCSGVTGGHIGYNIGIGAQSPKPQTCQQAQKDEAVLCRCNEEPDNKNEKVPCPVVTCDDRGQVPDERDREGSEQTPRFPDTIAKIGVGMSRVPRHDFAKRFEMGFPVKASSPGNEEVLILYSHVDALPNTMKNKTQSKGQVPLLTSIAKATTNCDYLNVVLTQVDYDQKICIALMGQQDVPHIQRFARFAKTGPAEVNSSKPLRFVSRLVQEMGPEWQGAPEPQKTRDHWELLHKYFENIDASLDKLRPLAEKAAKSNTLIVMFSNFGQSELIVNLCCSARNRNLDLTSVLFFATDPETLELAEGLGLTAFYDELNFGHLPSAAAETYGDSTFANMMQAKVMCLQMASMLGYDILFQDADMIWYQDPLPYFHDEKLPYADVFIADDGSSLQLYVPYTGNGGFFYLRNNRKTMYLLNSMLLLSDSNDGDEQYQLNQLMAEQASLFGLQVKTLNREEFPTGVVYHNDNEIMKSIFDGSSKAFMFHMSWTSSKIDKLLYFKQMGEWYVEEKCIGSKSSSLVKSSKKDPASLMSSCCAAKPLVSCHFADKPSVKKCMGSEMSKKADDAESFW